MEIVRKHGQLTLLIIIGLVVRILFMTEQGFSNDELSALCRTRFDSIGDLWYFGVRNGDMHPAFYQTLLWLWVKVFGENEFTFRIPSLIFYTLNSILIYRITSNYYTKSGGILMVALYTGLTFTVINTVFSRPYNSGTFFLLVSFLSVLNIQNNDKHKWRNALFLAVGLTGSMLSHYFAFWVAAVLGVCSLFFVGTRNLKYLIVSAILSIAMFLPHLEITMYQLDKGGLQWLAPPGITWVSDFIRLFFDNSWIAVAFAGCLLLALYLFYSNKKFNRTYTFSLLIFIASFVGAVIISYIYTPILRELVMLFLLPFLLIPLLSLIDLERMKRSTLLLVFIAIAFTTDSIFRDKLFGTDHFGVFKEIGEEINDADKTFGRSNITFASNYNSIDYINYYVDQDLKEEITDWLDQESVYKIYDRAKESSSTFFCYSFNNAYHSPMYLEVIRKFYPGLERNMLTKYSSFYLFSKEKKRELPPFFKSAISVDSSFTSQEFFGNIKIPVKDFPKRKGYKDYFLVSCEGKLLTKDPVMIVVSLETDGKIKTNSTGEPIFYSAYDQSKLCRIGTSEKLFTAFEMPSLAQSKDEISIYFWNPKKVKVHTGLIKIYHVE